MTSLAANGSRGRMEDESSDFKIAFCLAQLLPSQKKRVEKGDGGAALRGKVQRENEGKGRQKGCSRVTDACPKGVNLGKNRLAISMTTPQRFANGRWAKVPHAAQLWVR
ncbi:hypothetical protein AOLI_G00007740 [Acnodon oligacanthus]